MIGVIGAALVGREVALAGRAHDEPAPLGTARRAVDLSAVAGAAEREHHAACAAENEPVIVQEPAPDDAILATTRTTREGASVRAPAR